MSDACGIIARMFEDMRGRGSGPEVIARFDELCERRHPSKTPESAALRLSRGLAAGRLRYARAMRERLPKVADIFHAGDIDYRTFQTVASRTDLITDPDVLAAVDVPRRRRPRQTVRRREQKFPKSPLT
jgi:Domain of unknown function (DUF222)